MTTNRLDLDLAFALVVGAALWAAPAPGRAQAPGPGPSSAPASAARAFPPLRAGTTAPRATTAVPSIELLVDFRLAPADDAVAADTARGDVVVGTRAPVPTGWTATRSRDAAPPEVTTVRVMNGHEVAWHVDAAHIRADYDFVWTAQGQGIVSHDTVVHAARSLQATPRWAGGTAPVVVELAVAASRPRGASPDGADRDAGLRTTVSLALDEWVTVARLGGDDVQVRVRRR